MLRVPRFVLAPHDVVLEFPVGLWRVLGSTVGGETESDASYPASFVVRRDSDLAVPVLFTEAEWPALRELLLEAQLGFAFDWYPDAADAPIEVYLEAPTVDEDTSPAPHPELPRLLTLELVLRRADGAAWNLPFYPVEA